jgi:soluble lytic murein transglycosylase-like protein
VRRAARIAPAVALLASLAAAPAGGDEAIARRLAALHRLADPQAAPARPAPDTDSCPDAIWRVTELGVRSRTRQAIRDASLRFAVPADLLRSVIEQESSYDVDAVSHAGAQGLMQLMPATARGLGVRCPFDPRENVLGGARYLRRLRDRLGSWARALAGYHAGPQRVESGRIPAETRRYVRRVLDGWRPGRPDALGG